MLRGKDLWGCSSPPAVAQAQCRSPVSLPSHAAMHPSPCGPGGAGGWLDPTGRGPECQGLLCPAEPQGGGAPGKEPCAWDLKPQTPMGSQCDKASVSEVPSSDERPGDERGQGGHYFRH